jgi:hypothetical protein
MAQVMATALFLRKLLELRDAAASVEAFVTSPHNLELTYALLGLWSMESHRGRLKEFPAFCDAVQLVCQEVVTLETALIKGDETEIAQNLGTVYEGLHVMEGKNRLIASAKLLHFFFPDYFIPMDGEHTLVFFYGENASESKERLVEMTSFLFLVRRTVSERRIDWQKCRDKRWNANFPKIVDNVIFLLQPRKS